VSDAAPVQQAQQRMVRCSVCKFWIWQAADVTPQETRKLCGMLCEAYRKQYGIGRNAAPANQ
jgi:hypothetical protein